MGAMTMGAWATTVSMAMAAVRRWGRITPFRMRVALGSTGATTMAMPVRAEHTEQHEVDKEAEQCHDGHQLAVHLHGVNHPLGGTGGHRRGGVQDGGEYNAVRQAYTRVRLHAYRRVRIRVPVRREAAKQKGKRR